MLTPVMDEVAQVVFLRKENGLNVISIDCIEVLLFLLPNVFKLAW